MFGNLSFSRTFNTLKGIIAIAVGVLLILFPRFSVVSLVVAFGLFAVIAGIILILFSIFIRQKSAMWRFWLFEGVFDVLTGFFVLFFPEVTVSLFVVIIGIWAFILGIILLLLFYTSRKLYERNYRLLFPGILCLIFAFVLIFNPFKSAIAISVVIGTFAIIYGSVSIYFSGVRIRKSLN
jgi:uncharacterized membrane protein HdeD (DUF308 family)